MLDAREILSRDGVQITDVACRHGRGRGKVIERADGHALVFVRRGCFVRNVEGVRSFLDPTVAYCVNPGEHQRFDHPHEHGDDCTCVFLDGELVSSLWGGESTLPGDPLFTSPDIYLEHRLLLSQARRGENPHDLVERVICLTADVLERSHPGRVASGRPATERARRVIADETRQALASDTELPLPVLARHLAVSPHHLSRIFRALTGHTVSRHRMRLRVRYALERLAGGERELARLAAELGFADQSHLCRVLRAETRHTPSGLRELLS